MTSRLYGSRWRKERAVFLRANPLCVMCKERGRVVPAAIVDHITPHRGDERLFWDRTNWQALCKVHHDAHKQVLEKSGVVRGCDTNGLPLDPRHHWRLPPGAAATATEARGGGSTQVLDGAEHRPPRSARTAVNEPKKGSFR